MFVVGLFGGLASQMSQYTFSQALSRAYPDVEILYAVASEFQPKIQHNGFELEKIFGLKCKRADWYTITKLSNFSGRKGIKGKLLNKAMLIKTAICGGKESQITLFDPSVFIPTIYTMDPLYDRIFWGDWGEEYYKDEIESMKSVFRFPELRGENNLKILNDIEKHESVAVHVRRGDYITSNLYMLSEKYYRKAVNIIKKKVDFPKFYVFSDDLEYAKTMFTFIENKEFVEGNQGSNSYIDMQLMSSCNHIIAANSGFSCWGGHLIANHDKIAIAPRMHSQYCKYPIVSEKYWKIITDD